MRPRRLSRLHVAEPRISRFSWNSSVQRPEKLSARFASGGSGTVAAASQSTRNGVAPRFSNSAHIVMTSDAGSIV
ncbi:hypothetical protein Y025_5196 [Burkholderia pseudomallei TSV32]|nr:hypothetical protein Y025_5196 [Burkholderia pseudomallei TSV32]